MKNYKLIKEYPGSPELGFILPHTIHTEINKGEYILYDRIITPNKYIEFWEEVVEKDYEILEWVNPASKCFEYSLRQINSTWIIKSVKRLSDGEIFTIGDKVKGFQSDTNPFTINNIYIRNNDLIFASYPKDATVTKGRSCYLTTYTPEKVKQPLFTTEDGVDIFEGDLYCSINVTFFNNYGMQIAFSKKSPDLTPFWQSNRSVCRYFSTKEKAEEFIFMNKPCLSLNDLLSTNKWSKGGSVMTDLKKIVEQKIIRSK